MPTSGSTDYAMTARKIGTFALRKISVVDSLATPAAEDLRDAVEAMNLMLKTWQMTGPSLSRQTEGSVTLANSTASYALSPRPYRVVDARYRSAAGIDTPMHEMTRSEYFDIPLKTATGVPTCYYVDYQRDAVTMYVWPVPISVTTETIRHTFQRRIEDVDGYDEEIDIPQEWFETVGYALADRLMDTFGKSDRKITERAEQLVRIARDSDVEGVVRFSPGFGR